MFTFFKNKKIIDDRDWRKVSDLKVGMKIAVPTESALSLHTSNYSTSQTNSVIDTNTNDSDILWDDIVSIEHVGREQVWDIEVDGTHNFVGNDIFAHNTYVLRADPVTGIVGIGNDGTSLSGELMRVSGRIRATGFDIDSAADISENFPSSEAVDAGTIVSFSTSTTSYWSVSTTKNYQISNIDKAINSYDAIGVVSTLPGISLGSNTTSGVPVAMVGRVPVKVTNENGDIKRGDYVTVSSTTPGFGMKLRGEGRAIGIALSDYTENNDTVLVLIQVGNHKLDLAGRNATTTGMLTTGNLNLNANGVAIYNIKSLASANGTWSIDEEGRIIANSIEVKSVEAGKVKTAIVDTQKLCIGNVCVTEEQLIKILQQTNSGNTTSSAPPPTPEPIVAGTSTTGVADSNQQSATSTVGVAISNQQTATSTDTVTPPADPVIPPVVDPVVPPVDPPVVDPVI